MEILKESISEFKSHNFASSQALTSHEKFIERLKTFDLYKWFAKPSNYSPIECARRGWINSNKDTLKCVSCSKLFFAYTTRLKPLKSELLIENHNANCPWRTLTVPESSINVDVIDKEKALENFKKYLNSFENMQKLPVLPDNENFAFTNDELCKLETSSHASITKFILASCGWTFKNGLNTLRCEKCLRCVGLWLYKSEDENLEEVESIIYKIINKIELINHDGTNNENIENIDSGDGAPKKRKLSMYLKESNSELPLSRKNFFDQVNEHHSWCPWLNYADDKKMNMCQINFQLIKAHYTHTENADSVKAEYGEISMEKVKMIQKMLVGSTSAYLYSS